MRARVLAIVGVCKHEAGNLLLVWQQRRAKVLVSACSRVGQLAAGPGLARGEVSNYDPETGGSRVFDLQAETAQGGRGGSASASCRGPNWGPRASARIPLSQSILLRGHCRSGLLPYRAVTCVSPWHWLGGVVLAERPRDGRTGDGLSRPFCMSGLTKAVVGVYSDVI